MKKLLILIMVCFTTVAMAQVSPPALKKDASGKYVKGPSLSPTEEVKKFESAKKPDSKKSKKSSKTAALVLTDDRRKV